MRLFIFTLTLFFHLLSSCANLIEFLHSIGEPKLGDLCTLNGLTPFISLKEFNKDPELGSIYVYPPFTFYKGTGIQSGKSSCSTLNVSCCSASDLYEYKQDFDAHISELTDSISYLADKIFYFTSHISDVHRYILNQNKETPEGSTGKAQLDQYSEVKKLKELLINTLNLSDRYSELYKEVFTNYQCFLCDYRYNYYRAQAKKKSLSDLIKYSDLKRFFTLMSVRSRFIHSFNKFKALMDAVFRLSRATGDLNCETYTHLSEGFHYYEHCANVSDQQQYDTDITCVKYEKNFQTLHVIEHLKSYNAYIDIAARYLKEKKVREDTIRSVMSQRPRKNSYQLDNKYDSVKSEFSSLSNISYQIV